MDTRCNPILTACKLLVADGWHISCVTVERDDQNRWTGYITVTNNVPMGWHWPVGDGEETGSVSVALDKLPAGVSAEVWINRPSRFVVRIPRESADVYDQWIEQVAVAGKAPDWANIDNRIIRTKPIGWLSPNMRDKLLERYAERLSAGPRRARKIDYAKWSRPCNQRDA